MCWRLFIKSSECKEIPGHKSVSVSLTDHKDPLYCHIYKHKRVKFLQLYILQLVRKLRSVFRVSHITFPLGQMWGKCLGQGNNGVSVVVLELQLTVFWPTHLSFTHWVICYKELINNPGLYCHIKKHSRVKFLPFIRQLDMKPRL